MKAYITVGMPASGKTTWAENQKDFININLDDCRAEISGDAANQNVTIEAVKLQDFKIRNAASNNQNIIISDTNLNEKFRNDLELKLLSLGFEVEYVLFPISLELAQQRNKARDRVVPEHVLENMFSKFQTTNINGKILINQTLVDNSIIQELTQLANLEILYPEIFTKDLEQELLNLELIKVINPNYWTPGTNLISWLNQLGLLQLNLSKYLKSNIEETVRSEFESFSLEITHAEISKKMTMLFKFPISSDITTQLSISLMNNKNLIMSCYAESNQLENSNKLIEIIEDSIKSFYS